MEDNSGHSEAQSDNRNPEKGGPTGRGSGGRRGKPGFRRPRTSREWKLIESVVMEGTLERRRSRRWGIFFKLLTFCYLFFILWAFVPLGWEPGGLESSEEHVGLVELRGIIMDNSEANAERVSRGLRSAFEAQHAKAVILKVNSPGGSPVQSGIVYREIMRLRKLHPDKKIYAVITDIGASGAYYIAAAANEIYADQASIVGSIGVITAGFGFPAAIEKLGIERRVITAGESKDLLDPFKPVVKEQEAFLQNILDDVHQQFIAAVKEGRGARLKENPEIFSGLFWSGEQAKPLGLIDGFGSPGYVAREVIGIEGVVDYSSKVSPIEAFADRLGVSLGTVMSSMLGLETSPLQ